MAQQGERDGCLSGPRLTDNPEHLAGPDAKRDIVHDVRPGGADADLQVTYLKPDPGQRGG